MSIASATYSGQDEHLLSILKCFTACEVVMHTNKRFIVRCPDKHEAKDLAFNINDNGFAVEIKRGRQPASPYYYVRAFFN